MSGLTGSAVYGAVGKTLVKELSYDIAGDVIGSGTSSFVFDLTGNVNLSRLTGLSAGMMTSGKSSKVKGLNSLDGITSSTVKGLNHADSFTSTSKKFDRFAQASKAVDGLEEDSVNNKYYNSDGSPIWPPNRGFEGSIETITLKPGTLIDRYGYDGGTFVAPKGTPYTERSLPINTNKKPYSVFEVVKPVDVQMGRIASWFGEKGGGIQYEFNQRISDLLEQGIIRKVEF